MIANRVMYMGGASGANGAAEAVGHVQPLGFGSFGEKRGKRECGRDRQEGVESHGGIVGERQ